MYYDVGLRLKGSGFSRGSNATGVNLRFPREHLLFGEHDTVAVDRQGAVWGVGASQAELTIKHIANHAGDIPMMYDDVIQLIGPLDRLNGSAQLLLARYERMQMLQDKTLVIPDLDPVPPCDQEKVSLHYYEKARIIAGGLVDRLKGYSVWEERSDPSIVALARKTGLVP